MKQIFLFHLLALLPIVCQAQPATVEQCVKMALSHNVDIRNARLAIAASSEQQKSAFTHYFPKVDASAVGFLASHDLVRTEISLPIPQMPLPPLPMNMIDKGAVAMLTVMQPLYMGGQIVNGNRLARIQQQVDVLKMQMTELEVEQRVRDTYWQMMALRAQTATLDAAQKQLTEVGHHVDQYVQAGVTTASDQLRVQLKQQELESQRLSLDNGLEALRLLLAQLCGGDMSTFEVATEQIANPQPPHTYQVDPTAAAAARVETQLLQHAVQAKALQVKLERGKALPTVAIGAAGVYYNMMEKSQGTVMGLATVAVPISGWWSASHNVRRARLALQQQSSTLQDTEEKLRIDVLVAWNALCEAYAQIEVARRSVTQAGENLRLLSNQLQAGTISTTDFLDAFTLATQSRSTLAAACATYQSRVADYQRKTR